MSYLLQSQSGFSPPQPGSKPSMTTVSNRRNSPYQSSGNVTRNCFFMQHYTLPIGMVEIKRLRKSLRLSLDSTSEETLESEMIITFIRPKWLSELAFRCSISIHRDHLERESIGVTLRPASVSHNPSLLKAIENSSIDELQMLQQARQVHPTDYILNIYGDHVLYGRLITLAEVSTESYEIYDDYSY